MSEAKSSLGVHRQLRPVLDWRSARTWRVFVGLAIVLGTAISIIVILFGAAVDRLIDDNAPRQLVKVILGYPILCGLVVIGAMAVRRAFPLRDIEGKIVAKQSVFHLGIPAFWPLLVIGWALSFLAVFSGAAILARDLAGAFTEGFPSVELGYTAILSIFVIDLPIRALWRAPCQPEVSLGDE